jgi:hypothetical protein
MADPYLQKTVMGPLVRQVYQTTDHKCCLFRARMRVCADGAPKAYHPLPGEALGLDDLSSAGLPNDNYAIATDAGGHLCVQKADEQAPGFYVSMTRYSNPKVADDTRQNKYVDASTINYIVLSSPNFKQFTSQPNISLGNIGFAYNPANDTIQYAIFAETGPGSELGEASLQLVIKLGLGNANNDARGGGTESPDIIYGIFPGVSAPWPLSQSNIDQIAGAAFQTWGDRARLVALITDLQ